MPDIALLCRIFDTNPSDDLVTKRTEGINALSQAWKRKRNVDELLRIAAGIATGLHDPTTLPEQLAKEAVSLLSKNSAALIYQGHELEVATCAAAAVLAWIEAVVPSEEPPLAVPAVVASGLWSAMALQSPSANSKLEELRQQLLTASRECVLGYGRLTRIRAPVPPIKFELKEGEPGNEEKVLKRLESITEATLSTLRENAIRDREELEMLWWTVNDYSEILQKPLSQVPDIARAVVGALELSQLMRRLPSESQKHLAVRHVGNGDPITFQAILAGLGNDRMAIAKSYSDKSRVRTFPSIFPLLSAITSDEHKIDDSKTRSLVEWTKHLVLEGCVAEMNTDVKPEV